jgi:succinate dehydrogenase / fumarate reductase cytochrome b subunit
VTGWTWLRWHSLLGAVPLAGYLLLHLLGQALALRGNALQRGFQALLERSVLLSVLEIGLIYLPLCAHAGLGLWRVARSEPGSAAESEQRSPWPQGWGRSLQRLSAFVLLLFLVFHVWQFDGRLWLGELRRPDFLPELCASLSSTAFGGIPFVALGYLLGVAAAAVHATQGLYDACSSWGWVSPARRERLGRACLVGGIALFAVGALIIVQLATGSVS